MSSLDRPLKIVYVTMQFPAPSETFGSQEVRSLKSNGIAVSVQALRFAHRDHVRLIAERALGAVPITHGGLHAIVRGLLRMIGKLPLSIWLVSWIVRHNWRRPSHVLKSILLMPRSMDAYVEIRRETADAIHIYWGHYPAMVGALVQRDLPGTVVSMSLAAYDLRMEYGGSGPVARRADILRTLARINLPHIERVFGIQPSDILVIHDGVDTETLRNVAARITKNRFRVVTAGRLIPLKAVDRVIQAFAIVHRAHPGAQLIVLGDGPEMPALRAQASELGIDGAVEFRGHVTHEQVVQEMARAEVLLFLSRDERLPNVVKEAMVCRCVCVVSRTPGIEELLPGEQYGYVVEQGDIDSAADYVIAALSELTRHQAMLDNAQRYIETEFDHRASVQRYLDALKLSIQRKTTTGPGLKKVTSGSDPQVSLHSQ